MTTAAAWSDLDLYLDAYPNVGPQRFPQAIAEEYSPTPERPSDRGPAPVALVAVPVDELRHAAQHFRGCPQHCIITAACCLKRQGMSGTREEPGRGRWKPARYPECNACGVGRAVAEAVGG